MRVDCHFIILQMEKYSKFIRGDNVDQYLRFVDVMRVNLDPICLHLPNSTNYYKIANFRYKGFSGQRKLFVEKIRHILRTILIGEDINLEVLKSNISILHFL